MPLHSAWSHDSSLKLTRWIIFQKSRILRAPRSHTPKRSAGRTGLKYTT